MIIEDSSADEDGDDTLPSVFSAPIPRKKVKKARTATGKITLEDFSPSSALAARRGNQRVRLSTVIDNAFPDNKDAYAWQQYLNVADELSVNDPMFLGLERAEENDATKLAFARYVCFSCFLFIHH